jgi:hypothetical protein
MDSTVVMQYTPFTNSSAEIEPFPIILVVVAAVTVMALATVGVLIYLKKRKR